MATSKDEIKKLAASKPVTPPPIWPELPATVLKRFPELAEWTAQVREYFKQQSITK